MDRIERKRLVTSAVFNGTVYDIKCGILRREKSGGYGPIGWTEWMFDTTMPWSVIPHPPSDNDAMGAINAAISACNRK